MGEGGPKNLVPGVNVDSGNEIGRGMETGPSLNMRATR